MKFIQLQCSSYNMYTSISQKEGRAGRLGDIFLPCSSVEAHICMNEVLAKCVFQRWKLHPRMFVHTLLYTNLSLEHEETVFKLVVNSIALRWIAHSSPQCLQSSVGFT